MKKLISSFAASTITKILKTTLYSEANSLSTIISYEPQAPESLTHFKKEIFRKQK